MIFYPMVISAVAVLVTLVYASYLDIRDRRVPFRTWYPMLVVGISATIVLFYQQTGNISLIVGYLTLIASFFYADYLDNRDPETPFRFPYLAAGPALPALSWFIIPVLSTGKLSETQLIPWYVLFAGLLGYVSYREYKKQPVKKPTAKQARKDAKKESNIEEVLSRWYFVLVIVILAIASFYMIGGGSGVCPAFISPLLPSSAAYFTFSDRCTSLAALMRGRSSLSPSASRLFRSPPS